ncbi:MAG: glycosyltransferase family 1 protein [Gemmataceae bacterium]
MRVLINGLAAAGRRTGVGHYTAELARTLPLVAQPGDEAVCFQPHWAKQLKGSWSRLRDWVAPAQATHIAAGPARATLRARILDVAKQVGLWVYRQRFSVLARGGFDLYHEPNFIPLPCELPTITTVLDLSVLLHPQWHPADRVRDFERRFREGLRRCVHVLTIANFGRREVIEALGVPAERVSRAYMGVRSGFAPLPPHQVRAQVAQLGLPPCYLLHVGTLEPRKNLGTLLRAYIDLPRPIRERCPLVLVGGWGWNSADIYDFLQATGRDQHIVHVGYLPEAALPAVYNAARALVFPTYYEGFGMPIIEMFACGGAVLASTAGAVVEVASGQAHLIAPEDVTGWREAMQRIITDDDWHKQLGQGGPAIARQFTWEACARDTWQAYERALGRTTALAAPRAA